MLGLGTLLPFDLKERTAIKGHERTLGNESIICY